MAVTAAMIKQLREMTGVGMSTCKEALVEADGNLDRAVEILREKGLATADKKAGRTAAEGLSYAYITDDQKIAVVVEVNSETDFVAKNDKFKAYVEAVAKQVASSNAADVEALGAEKWIEDTSKTVEEERKNMVAVIGENITIRRFTKYVNDGSSFYVSYLHAGGKVAVLVEFTTDLKGDGIVECGKNVAMQIAAMNPKFLSRKDVPDDFLEKETEILTQQAKNDPSNEGKPEKVINGMIQGRLNKELKSMCLTDQEYVKAENKETVKDYVAAVSKELGGSIEIKSFVRFETGEGIEKKTEDFAAEVEKAMKG